VGPWSQRDGLADTAISSFYTKAIAAMMPRSRFVPNDAHGNRQRIEFRRRRRMPNDRASWRPDRAASVRLSTLTNAVFARFLTIFVALHGIVVCIAGADALPLDLLAGVDAGISICALCPGQGTCHDHDVKRCNSQHRIRSAHDWTSSIEAARVSAYPSEVPTRAARLSLSSIVLRSRLRRIPRAWAA
jgi:hypothetical protein